MKMTIKEIYGIKKSNSSHGNWAVDCLVECTIPHRNLQYTTQHIAFFFSKAEALNLQVGDEVK